VRGFREAVPQAGESASAYGPMCRGLGKIRLPGRSGRNAGAAATRRGTKDAPAQIMYLRATAAGTFSMSIKVRKSIVLNSRSMAGSPQMRQPIMR